MTRSSVLVPRQRRFGQRDPRASFTLVEMLVSTVILVLIVGIIFSLTQETSRAWKSTAGKIEVFRSSREAFETMTRTLSQATLNTYYDYAYVSNGTNAFVPLGSSTVPTTYARNSDMQIVAGQGSTLLTSLSSYAAVTHAVFFQVPMGMTTNSAYSNLSGLVNACGFYIAYGPDSSTPGFIPSTTRYRYRLMQFTQPSENLSVYSTGKGSGWYQTPIQTDMALTSPIADYVLAENVIALIILPKLAVKDELAAETAYSINTSTTPLGTALAPAYSYDSSTIGQGGTLSAAGISQYPLLNSFNQMPPVFQITMVALDEASALKLGNTATAPNDALGLTGLFSGTTPHAAANFQSDLAALEASLAAAHMKFRVFQTDVAVRGAKWTSDN